LVPERKVGISMTELSVDYSYARPSPAAIRAAGYAGVWRYLSGGTPTKDLAPPEAAALHAAGLGIGCIWETTAARALAGAAAGTADGIAAAAQAKAVGLPPGAPLLVNVADFAATPGELDALMAYYHAWRQETAGWQTGAYATGYVIGGLAARGATGLFWQNAMNDAGSPGSAVSPHAALYQRVSPTRVIAGTRAGDWDENVAVGAPAVAWWRPAAPPPATAAAGAARYVAGGSQTLAQFAAARGRSELACVWLTAQHQSAPGPAHVSYLGGILAGTVKATAPMPEGMNIWG
jgi:hypothetical protein